MSNYRYPKNNGQFQKKSIGTSSKQRGTSLRRIIALLLLSFTVAISSAQFKSLTIMAPDTVYVGEPFEMEMNLVSNGWSDAHWEEASYPFRMLRTLKADVDQQSEFAELKVSIEMVADRNGLFELPRYLVQAGGMERASSARQICVLPHKTYGIEQAKAYQWLDQECGMKTPLLDNVYHDATLSVFSDSHEQCFAIVADRRYWEKLSNPILAYSTESFFYIDESDSELNPLISQYIEQLQALNAMQPVGNWQSCQDIAPMLGKTAWGQISPYNLRNPKIGDRVAPVGCQVIALAQVMRYHQHPDVVDGRCCFRGPDGKYHDVSFPKWHPKWASYADTYSRQAGNANDTTISELCSVIGLATDANYGVDETSGNFRDSYRALCSLFGYSTQISMVNNLSEVAILNAICQELAHKRPCIASWTGHAFVCDGVRNGFLHYNMGWNGHANGYYQPIVCQPSATSIDHILIKHLLIGIEPQSEEVVLSVKTKKGGQLKSRLTDQQRRTVTHLKISGPLNSEDLKLIRHMAGDLEENAEWEVRTGGNLSVLDLTKAKIVSDKKPFLTMRATDSWTHTRTATWDDGTQNSLTKETFDFKQMDEKQWKEFCKSMGKEQNGVTYERVEDNYYLAHYHTMDNSISAKMFDNCRSLKTVLLPTKVSSIGAGAFNGCLLLHAIDIPKSVNEVSRVSFQGCSSLETITVHQQYDNVQTWCRNCCPLLQFETKK